MDVSDELRAAIRDAGITEDADLVARILDAGIGMGVDATDRLDLKIASAAVTEMREAFALFRPFHGVPKVTVFGSARTQPDDPHYQQASRVASALADRGWMVVTGAGPGIMQAASEGAGPEKSLGVSIRLPAEQQANEVVTQGGHNVTMKYFFTRKLMLVKESSGFICLPGGFGTMDEMFELLTLQQTGKAEPVPIVLLDDPGRPFWSGLQTFVVETLTPAGVISPGDLDRVLITDDITAAVDEITGFWRNYRSLRWVGQNLVLRLRHEPTADEVAGLNAAFGDLLAEGSIELRGPLRAEIEDDDELDAPRLVLTLNHRRVGELHRLIRALGSLPSAA
ncbi:MAG: TIGR00730 family Rossman fold protein [Microbacterium sp.]